MVLMHYVVVNLSVSTAKHENHFSTFNSRNSCQKSKNMQKRTKRFFFLTNALPGIDYTIMLLISHRPIHYKLVQLLPKINFTVFIKVSLVIAKNRSFSITSYLLAQI